MKKREKEEKTFFCVDPIWGNNMTMRYTPTFTKKNSSTLICCPAQSVKLIFANTSSIDSFLNNLDCIFSIAVERSNIKFLV